MRILDIDLDYFLDSPVSAKGSYSTERVTDDECIKSVWDEIQIPRTVLDACKSCPVLKQTGVYFLFGKDEETDNSVIYVGQAGVRKNGEGILARLLERKRLDILSVA